MLRPLRVRIARAAAGALALAGVSLALAAPAGAHSWHDRPRVHAGAWLPFPPPPFFLPPLPRVFVHRHDRYCDHDPSHRRWDRRHDRYDRYDRDDRHDRYDRYDRRRDHRDWD